MSHLLPRADLLLRWRTVVLSRPMRPLMQSQKALAPAIPKARKFAAHNQPFDDIHVVTTGHLQPKVNRREEFTIYPRAVDRRPL
jgi:hypothetical protein